MTRFRRTLLVMLLTLFCAAVGWQLFSRFAGGPMHRDKGGRHAIDSSMFAPHQ